ncbi:unnamed protein product [Arctia plantaginis]|uniref:Uncharacterized protein n=1 Tax=Arctia plantaginis TaxID=874455 RepID=A0A8S0YZ77_ARCPL|nr:unnamed protein product [Arctia plantaginis]CAB3256584.1 unnamed protein product [Arctia plantaginis]
MSSDDYQVQNIYRYSRRSYKKNRRESNDDDDMSPCESINIGTPEVSPRSDVAAANSPGCRCDLDPEVEIANILHKKCPVITLAQQQLQRLLEETDKILCDNTRCCRSVYDFLCLCQTFLSQDKCRCILIFFICSSFLTGLLFGAASCGSYLGRFNSPILACVDNFFMTSTYSSIEDSYRAIV